MADAPIEAPLEGAPKVEEGLPSPAGRNKKRMWLIGAVAVVVIGAATGLSLWLTGSSPATGLVLKTETVSVTTGTIQQTVSASGTLEPASQANLDFAVSGQVTAVDVQAGQQVAVGQVLATVGPTALQEEVDAAAAQLAAARDRLSGDTTAKSATTVIDSDEASVTSAESSLSTAQANLADASLTSTIAGTVASVALTVGQQVTGSGGAGGADASGGSNSGSSASQVVVIGTNSYLVNTTVDDTQIGQIAEGDQATITPSGASTVDYGTVASIGLIATGSSSVASFPVVIDVTGDPAGLYAGSSASVSIIVKQLNNVTEVPTAAITYSASGQADVVQVINGHNVTKAVTVGEAENGETQVTGGVVAGDKVQERVVTFNGLPGGRGGTGLFGGTGGSGFTRVGGFGGGGGGAVFNGGGGGGNLGFGG